MVLENPELARATDKLDQEAAKESALLHEKEAELLKAMEEVKTANREIEMKKTFISTHEHSVIPKIRREIDALKLKQRMHFNKINEVRNRFGGNIHDPKKIKLN